MNRKKRKGLTEPMRTCAGCRKVRSKKEMIRIALYEGVLTPDPEARRPGRGIYVCRDMACLEKAEKGGIMRGFRRRFDSEEIRRVCGCLSDLIGDGK